RDSRKTELTLLGGGFGWKCKGTETVGELSRCTNGQTKSGERQRSRRLRVQVLQCCVVTQRAARRRRSRLLGSRFWIPDGFPAELRNSIAFKRIETLLKQECSF